MKTYLPSVVMGGVGLAVAAIGMSAPRDASRVVAIFPPWWSSTAAFAAAADSGAVSGIGSFKFIIGLRGNAASLAERAKANGALFVVDGRAFAICGAK